MTSNALSIRGVFSERPLSPNSIERLAEIPEPTPIVTFAIKSEIDVLKWTREAIHESNEFKKMVKEYASKRMKDLEEQSGGHAYLLSVINFIF